MRRPRLARWHSVRRRRSIAGCRLMPDMSARCEPPSRRFSAHHNSGMKVCVALLAHGARVVEALAPVRAMQDWLRQLIALHALAPYLAHGQVTGPLTDILVWSEDFLDEQPYRVKPIHVKLDNK